MRLVEQKRADYYTRERANAERRARQDEERAAEERRKEAAAIAKGAQRKVRAGATASSGPLPRTTARHALCSPALGGTIPSACVRVRMLFQWAPRNAVALGWHDSGAAAQEVYKQAEQKQADTVAGILAKARAQDESMARDAARREAALSRKKLERQLNMESRMEAVDTNRKQQLYGRERLLAKIETETERVQRMQRERAALQRQRREANMDAALQRQRMVEKMERLQQAKKFDKIASGQVSLEALMR